jgi:hypothetical protein
MTQAVSKSRSRKANGCLKAILVLETARRRRQERYDRFVRPLDRKRDALEAEVAARMRGLSGGQRAEARRILREMAGATSRKGGRQIERRVYNEGSSWRGGFISIPRL